MDNREYLANAAVAVPARPAVPSAGYPQGGATPTKPGAYWYHQIGESLRALLTAAGVAPDATTLTLLRDAVNVMNRLTGASTAVAGGTADALIGAYTPAVAALANGLTVFARAASANATTTPTFTPNTGTLAAKPIVKGAGAALLAGDIAGAGHELQLRYNSTLDKWVLLNPAAGVNIAPQFQTTFAGNGSHRMPNGLLLQWITGSVGVGGTAFSWPVAFPSALLMVLASSYPQNAAIFANAYNGTSTAVSGVAYNSSTGAGVAANITIFGIGN